MEKVSVIIPVFNQETFLDRSLQSVMDQSYKNLEIICINDGSTDRSGMILDAYRNEDKRIIVINQENGGLVYAVAQGVKRSTGEYICFLDSDDYLDSKFILTAISEIGSNDFIAFSHFYDNGESITENKVSEDITLDAIMMKQLRNNLVWDEDRKQISKGILNSRWNKMYRAECVKSFIDIYEDCKGISLGEDTLFTYLLLLHSKSAIVKRKTNGYYYNINNNNSMMSEGTIDVHITKAKESLYKFNQLLALCREKSSQPYAMYLFLIEPLFQRLEYNGPQKEFFKLYFLLKKDPDYTRALNNLILHSSGRRKAVFMCRRYIWNPRLYKLLFLVTKKKREIV